MAHHDDIDCQESFYSDNSVDFSNGCGSSISGSPSLSKVSLGEYLDNEDALFYTIESENSSIAASSHPGSLHSQNQPLVPPSTPNLEKAFTSNITFGGEFTPFVVCEDTCHQFEHAAVAIDNLGPPLGVRLGASMPSDIKPTLLLRERRKSSRGRPPISLDSKAALSAGIAKANQKPCINLPPVLIEADDDEVTAKRKKNTVAARKSRARTQETLLAMSREITRLRKIIETLGGEPGIDFGL